MYFLSELVCFLQRISRANMPAFSFAVVDVLHFMRQKNERLAPGHNNDKSCSTSVFNGSIAESIGKYCKCLFSSFGVSRNAVEFCACAMRRTYFLNR